MKNGEIMDLEFELRKLEVTENSITYEILRKGLSVGRMYLDEPYNRKEAQRILMNLTNELK